MRVRPKSITFISWFLIITSVISVVTTAFSYNNPETVKMMELSPVPISLQYVLMAIGLAITVTCGVLMLKGENTGRTLYVGWTVIALVTGFFVSPVKALLIPGVAFFIVITFFLYRPKANEYFADVSGSTPT
ncbi:MAG: hypothetical protein AAGF57_12175 [Pseudomonadota bacterium]